MWANRLRFSFTVSMSKWTLNWGQIPVFFLTSSRSCFSERFLLYMVTDPKRKKIIQWWWNKRLKKHSRNIQETLLYIQKYLRWFDFLLILFFLKIIYLFNWKAKQKLQRAGKRKKEQEKKGEGQKRKEEFSIHWFTPSFSPLPALCNLERGLHTTLFSNILSYYSPRVGTDSPLRIFSNDDLPDPLWPRTAVIWPSYMSKNKPSCRIKYSCINRRQLDKRTLTQNKVIKLGSTCLNNFSPLNYIVSNIFPIVKVIN